METLVLADSDQGTRALVNALGGTTNVRTRMPVVSSRTATIIPFTGGDFGIAKALARMPSWAKLELFSLAGQLLLRYFPLLLMDDAPRQRSAYLEDRELDEVLGGDITYTDLSSILGGIGSISKLLSPILTMTGVGAPVGMALGAVGSLASETAKPKGGGIFGILNGLMGDKAWKVGLTGVELPERVHYSKRTKQAIQTAFQTQKKNLEEAKTTSAAAIEAAKSEAAAASAESAAAIEELQAALEETNSFISQQPQQSGMSPEAMMLMMQMANQSYGPEPQDAFDAARCCCKKAPPASLFLGPTIKRRTLRKRAKPLLALPRKGARRTVSQRRRDYGALADANSWPRPETVLAHIANDFRRVRRISQDGQKPCCNACSTRASGVLMDCCSACASGGAKLDAAFASPEALPAGEFFKSSWVTASLTDLPEGTYGMVRTGKRPFEVSINRNVELPRAQVSFAHEMMHVLDDLLKLNISHEQIHHIAVMLVGEVLPGLNLMSETALRS